MEQQKVKLFTHTDLDGIGSYVLAVDHFGKDNVNVEFCSYNAINKRFREFLDNKEYTKFNHCFITDISVETELANRVEEILQSPKQLSSTTFILLDHHGTRAELNEYSWCTETEVRSDGVTKTCGTELFYNHLKDVFNISATQSKDQLVELICNYDTWRWNDMGDKGLICKQVNDLFLLYGRDKFTEWCLDRLNNPTFPVLDEADKNLLTIRQNEIDSYIASKARSMKIVPYKNYKMGVVFADRFHSELGNTICERCKAIDFIAIIDMPNRVSFRSLTPEIDVGEIAKELGGGGHPTSLGAVLKEGSDEIIINHIFNPGIQEF